MPLLSAFHRQCRTAPDSIALCEGERRLSYRQLERQACQLRARILTASTNCERVAIALERGIDATIAILATLQAGACYVPLDMKNPADRLRFICSDAAPHCIIGQGPCPDWLEHPSLWLDIAAIEPPSTAYPSPQIRNDEAMAAILYTSGSTGTPKGVALSHRAMTNFADWAVRTFNIGPADRIASLAPFHFDLSVFDLFASLRSGATVCFVPAGLTLSPSRLSAWLSQQRITVFYTVPSLLAFLALKGALTTTPLPALKSILFAGEVFPTAQLKQLCELLPRVEFFNLYGPTETNVCCYWPVERRRLRNNLPIPIGFPASGAELKITDSNGELLVKCANNLSGYWQQGRLVDALSADGYFASGDKVSLNEHGEVCYHGRLDRMLKCSGHRVEPAEIETALLRCPGVTQCAVVGIIDSASGHRPAAALVVTPGADLATIVKTCKQRLPTYMHPCKFIVLETLPYLSNGKIDYQALKLQLEPS
ncbi:amino acid adenylation domain-containing protein [Methylomarinum vadi]|uniref:amino acid adenylation domain-containing protein n=1 Tax=Methylomarinum vadi TaxID=438855 RepID=UPI0004DEFC48|nr:amino acid adenylation domain-containing protein [Methylomarinum vadi]